MAESWKCPKCGGINPSNRKTCLGCNTPNLLSITGAEVNEQNKGGDSPLIHAVVIGSKEIVDGLLAKGADLNNQNQWGNTALILAADKGYKDIVDRLLVNGADVNLRNHAGDTALILAATLGHKEIVHSLLAKDIDVEIKNNSGSNALMVAAAKGHSEITADLLEQGVKLNSPNKEGDTALHIAASRGHKEIVDHLLDKGADANIKDNAGNTALILAVASGHKEIVNSLLAKDVDKNVKNVGGNNALILAATKGFKEIVDSLLAKGADGNIVDNAGNTALILAVAKGNKDIVNCLLVKDIDVNVQNTSGSNALILAAAKAHKEILDSLLARGADPNIPNHEGDPALNIAASRGYKEIVESLLAKGAEVDVQDDNDKTALLLATSRGFKEIADALVAKGANPNIQNKPDLTAPVFASEEDYIEQCLSSKFLEEHETRTWRSDPEFHKVLDPLNKGDNSAVCKEAEQIIPKYRDLDLIYFWWAKALLNTCAYDKARAVLRKGLAKARRKSQLSRIMGEVAWKTNDLRGAVYWWAQAMHGQEPMEGHGRDEGVYLYLHYVADGMGLTDIASAFISRVDKMRAGQIRLDPSAVTSLLILVHHGKNPAIVKVLKELAGRYLFAVAPAESTEDQPSKVGHKEAIAEGGGQRNAPDSAAPEPVPAPQINPKIEELSSRHDKDGLIEIINSDPDITSRAMAVEALAKLTQPYIAVGTLIECMEKDPSGFWHAILPYLSSQDGVHMFYRINFPRGVLEERSPNELEAWLAERLESRASIVAHLIKMDIITDKTFASRLIGKYGDNKQVDKEFYYAYEFGTGTINGLKSKYHDQLAQILDSISSRTALPKLRQWAIDSARSLRAWAQDERSAGN
jgi:ankyrin repeat protein